MFLILVFGWTFVAFKAYFLPYAMYFRGLYVLFSQLQNANYPKNQGKKDREGFCNDCPQALEYYFHEK